MACFSASISLSFDSMTNAWRQSGVIVMKPHPNMTFILSHFILLGNLNGLFFFFSFFGGGGAQLVLGVYRQSDF